MSKRFGRNQKRRMRSEIARLESEKALVKDRADILEERNANLELAHLMDSELLKSMNNNLGEMRKAMSTFESVVGPYFIGLPPKVNRVDKIHDVYRIPSNTRVSTKLWDSRDISELSVKVHSLETTMLDAEYKELLGRMHIRLNGPAGEFAYTTTPEALMYLPKNEFIERLSCEFATTMANSEKFNKAFHSASRF